MYTPVVIYILSLFLRLGGQYLIVERLAALCISVFGIVFLGLFTHKLTKNMFITFLSMLLYSVWGPAHLNFMWPVMTVLPFVFCYLFFLRGSHFFLSGVAIGVILLSKHNFGAAVLLSFIFSSFFLRYSKRQITSTVLGFSSVVGIFITHLLATQSFIPFIADMNIYTIQEILIKKSLSVPFPADSLGKCILYLSPALVSIVIGVVLVYQKKGISLFFIPLTTLALYFFGIFPTPDWPHLTPLLSTLGVLFILISTCKGTRYKYISIILLVCTIIAGLYSLKTRNYYRWEAPLINNIHCYTAGTLQYMCLDDKNNAIITQTLPLIIKSAAHSSSIFTFYNDPIYYFIAQKNNPTRYINFDIPIGKKEEQYVIDTLEKMRVTCIITRFSLSNSPSKILTHFIETQYHPIQESYEFIVWTKNN